MIASLRSTWILLGALALGVALACGGDTQEAASAAKDWEQTPESKPPPRSGGPEVVITELPADFPADVPRYPGAEVVQVRVSANGGTSVTFSVKDGVEKVASFYADSLAAEGWSTDMKEVGDGSLIFADKPERRLSAGVHSTDEGTQVDLIIVQMP